MVSLNFKELVLEGAPSTAGGFELGEQGGEVIPLSRQPSNDGDEFALFSLFDGERRRLLRWRNGRRRRRRALTLALQLPASLAPGRTIKRGSGEKSGHAIGFLDGSKNVVEGGRDWGFSCVCASRLGGELAAGQFLLAYNVCRFS